jgi:hypothetical protein
VKPVLAFELCQPVPEALQFLKLGMVLDLTICVLTRAEAASSWYQGKIRWYASNADGTPIGSWM